MRGSTNERTIWPVRSVEPSSTTTTSKSPTVWARTLVIASAMYFSWLYVGTMTLISGCDRLMCVRTSLSTSCHGHEGNCPAPPGRPAPCRELLDGLDGARDFPVGVMRAHGQTED